jgi:hypothetical protein
MAATDWLAHLSHEPERVKSFCQAQEMTGSALTAVRMAERHFPTGSKIALSVETDPESDGEWLVVDVAVPTRAGDALQSYDRFIREWAMVPNGLARERISLTFSLV